MISAISNTINRNYSPVSFQANLVSEIPIKDAKKLLNVQRIFSEKSGHYKSDKLTIGKSLDSDFEGCINVRITDEIDLDDYKYSFLIENFSEMFDKLSENEIAKKLLSYFKTLKKAQEFDNVSAYYKSAINNTNTARINNLRHAAILKKLNKTGYAKKYESLAVRNQRRIEELKKQKNERLVHIANNMEKSIGNNENLRQVPEIFLNAENIERV